MSTFRQLLKEGEGLLREAGVPDWQLDAWYLFADSFSVSRASYYVKEMDEAEDREAEQLFWQRLRRRAQREPLQYILGEQEFMGLSFRVSPAVLIPRQDTETLVEEVLADEKAGRLSGRRGLDICTGSGCIAVSLAVLGGFSMDACDLSEAALEVARENSLAHEAGVRFWQGDLLSAVPGEEGRYDLILSNPPYIPAGELAGLQPEVQLEPKMALDGSEDGLVFYRRLAADTRERLKDGGRLYLEIGHDQGEAVSELLKEQGFSEVQVLRDAAGKDRVVKALWRK